MEKLHWAGGTQRAKARVHLGHHPAGEAAGGGIGGPEALVGVPLGQRLGHRQSVAHEDAVGRAHQGDKAGGGQIGECGLHGSVIDAEHMLAIGDAELFKHQPAAQRPAREARITDVEIVGYVGLLGVVAEIPAPVFRGKRQSRLGASPLRHARSA